MMCTPTIAAAVAPHIHAFIWITATISGAMFVFALGMLWERRQWRAAAFGLGKIVRPYLTVRHPESAAREVA